MSSFIVYKAKTTHLAAEEVLSRIEGAGRHIVIAPDPFTFAVEKAISDKLNKKAFFNVEVMSFARLASVFLGEKAKRCLSPAGSVMLMEKIIGKEKDSLIYYQNAAGMPGFAAELYAAVTAIRNSGVSPKQLRDAGEGLPAGYVKSKTLDIARLYAAYLNDLSQEETEDGTTLLEALARYIKESGAFADVNFYVVDHVDFNAKQVEVLAALMTEAKSLTVALADGAGLPNERIYDKRVFTRLAAAAKRVGVVPRTQMVTAALDPSKNKLAEELFSYSFTGGSSDGFSLTEAKDAAEEVAFLATEITRLVRKDGLRYNQIAVITPSFDSYLPILSGVFRDYGIPFFADRRVPLSDTDLFKHLILAMEISCRGYDKILVKKYVMHALFDSSEEEKEAFFDYVDMSGADRGYLKKPFDLFKEDPRYDSAEKVRKKLTDELAPFDLMEKTGAVSTYAEAFERYLSQNDFTAKVNDYLAKVFREELLDQAEILRQGPAAIMELLKTLTELRGDEILEFKDFILTLTAGAGQVKIAALPVSLDCVYFAPVEQAMYAPIPALFVLGAEQGLFPLENTGEGIVGEKEYQAWQPWGVVIQNTGREELAQSRFHALQLLLRGDRTYLSHVEAKRPSQCFSHVREIFDLKIKKCSDLLKTYDIDVLIPTERVAEVKYAAFSRRYHEGLLDKREEVFARAVAKHLNKEFPLPFAEENVEKVDAAGLFFKEGKTSVSELECYFKCPFLHFVQYGLKAKEKDAVSFDLRDTGIIVHECMMRFVKQLKKQGFSCTDDEARAIAQTIAEEILADPKYEPVKRASDDRAIARVKRRCGEVAVIVKNQIAASSFVPALLEKHFPEKEHGGPLPPLKTVAPGGVSLTGQIDRVDVCREDGHLYAAAMDYKTGSAVVGTDDLYIGKKIQLPLYLAVLEASGYDPVAALYYSLSDRQKKKAQALYGPKLWEDDMVQKLDNAVSTEPSPYTGVYQDKKGLVDKQKMLLAKREFDAQTEYAVLVAEGAVNEIREGFVLPTAGPTGQGGACDYCKAKAVCRMANKRNRKKVSVGAEELADVVFGKMEEKDAGQD